MSPLTILAGLVCEEVRPEMDGRRATIVGYIGMLPFAEIYRASFESPMTRLCFLFTVETGEASFLLKARLLDPNGKDILDEPVSGTVTLYPKGPSNLAINFQDPFVKQPGRYTCELSADDEVFYSCAVEISQEPDASHI